MVLSEKIQQYLDKLPESSQSEVLDFIEYLLAKAESEATRSEDKAWLNLSLASAMRGMEGEKHPAYTLADLKVTFS